ncbi:MAG: hypothetical protein HGA99_01345 [Chlorobiaceae bacterium]|nr:hypothetical protein [Chlorobiaceae bacterium]
MVEHIGSGIRRIRNLCRDYGVAEPLIEVSEHWFTVTFPRSGVTIENGQPDQIPHVTPHVSPHVMKVVSSLPGEINRDELMKIIGVKDRMYFMRSYLKPAIAAGFIEMTFPERPRSKNQRYRLTERGFDLLKTMKESK